MPERSDQQRNLAVAGRRGSSAIAGRGLGSGFSLIEALVVMSIAAVLLGLAMPSLRSLSGDARLSATVNGLVFSLQTARSEAIKRAAPVVLCASAAPLDDGAACDSRDYATGWIVYADTNGDGNRASGEKLILQEGPPPPAFEFPRGGGFAPRVLFDAAGVSRSPAGAPLRVVIDIDHPGGDSRAIVVATNGRIASETP